MRILVRILVWSGSVVAFFGSRAARFGFASAGLLLWGSAAQALTPGSTQRPAEPAAVAGPAEIESTPSQATGRAPAVNEGGESERLARLALPPAFPHLPRSRPGEVCDTVEAAAVAHDLPADFFTRLIWQESRFNAKAVSPKGAQGIAQFMPGTAADRGLSDPFDPLEALPASASFLKDLRAQFGNVGLAAAAYNAGPQRVADWLAGRGGLPGETRQYVRIITGRTAEEWAAASVEDPENSKEETAAAKEKCKAVVAALKIRKAGAPVQGGGHPSHGPWGAEVAASYSKEEAVGAYRALQNKLGKVLGQRPPMILTITLRAQGPRPFHRVRVPAQSQKEATQLCRGIRAAGARCLVFKT